MEDYTEFLTKASLFEGCSPMLLRSLNAGCRIKSYRGGEHLFHELDPGGTMFIVLSGQVSIERINDRVDRDEVVQIALRYPGEVIGELSIFEEMPRTADARATVDSRLLVVDGRHFSECLKRDGTLALNVIRNLSLKLRQAMDRRSSQQTETVRVKLAKELLAAASAFGEADQGSTRLKHKLTQQELANRIGCTREVVNRAMAEMGPDVVESSNGRIVIHDLNWLTRVVKIG